MNNFFTILCIRALLTPSRFNILLLFTIILLGVFLILTCFEHQQIIISDTTCMYMEIVDPTCLNFVTSKDYGNIIIREYRISVHKCLNVKEISNRWLYMASTYFEY